MNKLKYIPKDYIPKGDLEGYPLEIIDKMIERQVEQGNESNVSVFEHRRATSKLGGGFDWQLTQEEKDGYGFWLEVIANRDFNLFFQKYPNETYACGIKFNYVDASKTHTYKVVPEEVNNECQWVPAEDFGVFEIDEHDRWEVLADVEFLGAIFDYEGEMVHFGLFMFDENYFLEWDNMKMEFLSSDIPLENITHCAPYPKWPKPEVEDEIWDLVNNWCEGQYKDVPDMNRRYLMDKILEWYNKKQKA